MIKCRDNVDCIILIFDGPRLRFSVYPRDELNLLLVYAVEIDLLFLFGIASRTERSKVLGEAPRVVRQSIDKLRKLFLSFAAAGILANKPAAGPKYKQQPVNRIASRIKPIFLHQNGWCRSIMVAILGQSFNSRVLVPVLFGRPSMEGCDVGAYPG